ncbi:hypothetical protein AMATHDRAFT_105040, partial [Amanita thiersii Skay4041]
GGSVMHEHEVAHLDLKPENLVIREGDLQIVDFGPSFRVSGRKEVVKGFRGTRPWVAPEVGKADMSDEAFSPIAADLWATGRII